MLFAHRKLIDCQFLDRILLNYMYIMFSIMFFVLKSLDYITDHFRQKLYHNIQQST